MALMDQTRPFDPATDELYRRHFRRVVTFFERKGCSKEESRDLAQETFFRVYKGMETFRGASSETTWILQIASNLFKNTLRGQATQKRYGHEVPLEPGSEVAEGHWGSVRVDREKGALSKILAEERCRILREAMQELPPQMREVVLLRVDRDLKYREIAVLLHVSIETVKAHLYQARERLRDKLADYFTGDEF